MKTISSRRTSSYKSRFSTIAYKDFVKNKTLYLMVLPVLIFYAIFCYKPMYGVIIAFKDFNPSDGIMSSPWIGFEHFKEFFSSYYFSRVLKNTIVISLNNLIYGFPAPIILAILINEIRLKVFKRTVQTISYMPHFISLVVICGIIKDFTSEAGVINDIISFFGGKPGTMLNNAKLFLPVYVISGIWQEAGWGSIIYLAALMAVDQQLYEAAKIDGAGFGKQLLHVTLPGISPTIVIMLILRIGNMMNLGFEKIILLYNPLIYETSDVISSFVYRKGLQEFNWGFSTAVGLFNSLINFALLISANKICKQWNETSLW